MPTTLLFGGTFDPIHFGHLRTAQAAASLLSAQHVLFIPAHLNPLKQPHAHAANPARQGSATELAGTPAVTTGVDQGGVGGASGGSRGGASSAQDRLAMARLATAGNAQFIVEDLELRRPPPSYTIDTIQALLPKYGPHLTLLIGADQLMHFHHWHRVTDLLAQVHIAILARPGTALDSGLDLIRNHLGQHFFEQFRASILTTPLVNISATTIRQRVKSGLPIDHLTPAAVVEYIRTHHLYV